VDNAPIQSFTFGLSSPSLFEKESLNWLKMILNSYLRFYYFVVFLSIFIPVFVSIYVFLLSYWQ